MPGPRIDRFGPHGFGFRRRHEGRVVWSPGLGLDLLGCTCYVLFLLFAAGCVCVCVCVCVLN